MQNTVGDLAVVQCQTPLNANTADSASGDGANASPEDHSFGPLKTWDEQHSLSCWRELPLALHCR